MDTVKAEIYKDDVFMYFLRTEEEMVDLFGEDYIEEYAVTLPKDLVDRYQKINLERRAINQELRKIYEAANK